MVNGTPEERPVLGPFCKQLRMQLEDKWSPVYVGYLGGQKETTIRRLVLQNGRIVLPDSENPNISEAERLAIGVVTELANETGVVVPAGKEFLEINATFKLRTQGPNRPGLEELVAGLLALAAVAATGYAVYKLGTMNSSSGYVNPDYEWVNYPHTRADGTFSAGYWRSRRNGTMFDNFSSLGNINPFTGEIGRVVPKY